MPSRWPASRQALAVAQRASAQLPSGSGGSSAVHCPSSRSHTAMAPDVSTAAAEASFTSPSRYLRWYTEGSQRCSLLVKTLSHQFLKLASFSRRKLISEFKPTIGHQLVSHVVSSAHLRTKDVKTILLQPQYILENCSVNRDLNPLIFVRIRHTVSYVSTFSD